MNRPTSVGGPLVRTVPLHVYDQSDSRANPEVCMPEAQTCSLDNFSVHLCNIKCNFCTLHSSLLEL